MTSNRNTAIIAGILFITAAVSSIIGLLLYDPVLHNSEYILEAGSGTQIVWGAFFEIVLAFSVIGTSITLFPILKIYNESMAMGTVAFRLLEAALIILGIISLLSIVTLSQEVATTGGSNVSSMITAGKLLVVIHNWTFLYGPNLVLGPSTLMTSYLLYKSKLVPSFITYLGLAGGPLIFICALLVMFGAFPQISLWGALLAIPVFMYEMSLAIWLIINGFNSASVMHVPVQNLFKLAAGITHTPANFQNKVK